MASTVYQVWKVGKALLLAEGWQAKAQGWPDRGTLEFEGSKSSAERWLNMELAPANARLWGSANP